MIEKENRSTAPCSSTPAATVSRLDWKTAIALAVALLCWASAFPAIRLCVRHFSPGELALGRFLIASLAVAPALFFSRPRLPRFRDAGWFFLQGFLGYFVYHVCLNFGETVVTAGAASFLINTAPVWASLLAVLFLGERPGARGWIGIGISFVGALLIAASSTDGFGFRPEALLIFVIGDFGGHLFGVE